jgi:hypothetical protein
MSNIYPLALEGGHLYVQLDHGKFLIDTGSPLSFSELGLLDVCGYRFNLPTELPGLTLPSLREFVKDEFVAGLLGNDVLGQFYHRWDLTRDICVISKHPITIEGEKVIHIPLSVGAHASFDVVVGHTIYPSLFDTGAQISYMPDKVIDKFPDGGEFYDFHQSVGAYKSRTAIVSMEIWSEPIELRCASYEALGWDGRQSGIIGNDLIKGRVTGYFPRAGLLVLA